MKGSQENAGRSIRWLDKLLFALATAGVAYLYLRVLFNQLVWDDVYLITSFSSLHQSDGLLDLLSRPFWDNSSFLMGDLGVYWRPVTTLLLWLVANYLPASPASYHLISVLASAGASFALFQLLRRLLPCEHRSTAKWLALLFASHPLVAEVISMAANAADHLVLALLTTSVTLQLRLIQRKERALDYVLLFISALLCCGAKELGVLIIGSGMVAAVLAWVTGAPFSLAFLRRPVTWLTAVAAAIIYLVYRGFVVAHAEGQGFHYLGLWSLTRHLFWGFGHLLYKAILPFPTGAHTYFSPAGWSDIITSTVMWSGALAASILAWRGNKLARWPLVGLGVALAFLAPSLLTTTVYVEITRLPVRYLHAPMVGLLIACTPWIAKIPVRAVSIAGFTATLLLTTLSWTRVDEWYSEESFYYAEARHNPRQHYELLNLVETQLELNRFEQAAHTLNQLETLPGAQKGKSRALLLGQRAILAEKGQGNYQDASSLLEEALRVDPTNLALVLDLARVRDEAGHPEQAAIILQKAGQAPWFQDHRQTTIEPAYRHYATKSKHK